MSEKLDSLLLQAPLQKDSGEFLRNLASELKREGYLGDGFLFNSLDFKNAFNTETISVLVQKEKTQEEKGERKKVVKFSYENANLIDIEGFDLFNIRAYFYPHVTDLDISGFKVYNDIFDHINTKHEDIGFKIVEYSENIYVYFTYLSLAFSYDTTNVRRHLIFSHPVYLIKKSLLIENMGKFIEWVRIRMNPAISVDDKCGYFEDFLKNDEKI